jgi:predicted tellurium resistance membrane protein TerC
MADFFATHFAFITTPEGWAAMVTLVAMEVVLGIDNLDLHLDPDQQAAA